MMGIVGQHEPQQEVLQCRILFFVAEGGLDHVPEWNVEVEFFYLAPDNWRRIQFKVYGTTDFTDGHG